MSLSKTTLSTIQQAGAAVFAADAELKNSVKDYAQRVNTAMASNPFGLGNDALFENWKLVARLSQTMAGIEEELKKVHALASELTDDDGLADHTLPALSAPLAAQPSAPELLVATAADIAPTDVVAKAGQKKVARKALAKKPALASPPVLGGNPTKLLRHLQRLLNTRDFMAVNLSAAGLATGIPAGSVNAAVKKLLEIGLLLAGPGGRFKLAK
jgi:hypothetical protein